MEIMVDSFTNYKGRSHRDGIRVTKCNNNADPVTTIDISPNHALLLKPLGTVFMVKVGVYHAFYLFLQYQIVSLVLLIMRTYVEKENAFVAEQKTVG
ncbi:hypothetical protein OUZ56_015036 [Daphnia magna]|uniref:Uncharacterized protein n=1 Tax=Daphnia magna TaxID=35525 RepID=A0ABR0ALK8_9CRUS|nr:hypothetical protein OUZ56_015036 [Daphnia magna]